MTLALHGAGKPTILFIWANPAGTPPVNTPEEEKRIKEIVEPMFNVESLPAAHADEIRTWISKYKPVIVHWSGHGMPPSGGGGGAARERNLSPNEDEPPQATLVVEGEGGKPWAIPNDALAGLFEFLKESGEVPRCVVLNACFTEEQAASIAAHVDFVVGTTRPILDTHSIMFSEKFYGALVRGASLGEAFKSAKIDVDLSNPDPNLLKRWVANPKAEKLRLRRSLSPAIAAGGSAVTALVALVIALVGRNHPDAAVDTNLDAGKGGACAATCCRVGSDDCSKGCPSQRDCIPYACNADLPETDTYRLRIQELRNAKAGGTPVPTEADVCLRHATAPPNEGWTCWPTENGIAKTKTPKKGEAPAFTVKELLETGVDVEIRPAQGSTIRASHPVTVPVPTDRQRAPGLHASALCVGWKMHVSKHDTGADDYDLIVYLDDPP